MLSNSDVLEDVTAFSSKDMSFLGILYKADPEPDPDLQKKWTPDL